MADENCSYYRSKKIKFKANLKEICVSPLRYGEKLELEDIEGFENHYSCDCNNHKRCFWHSPESRLKSLLEKK